MEETVVIWKAHGGGGGATLGFQNVWSIVLVALNVYVVGRNTDTIQHGLHSHFISPNMARVTQLSPRLLFMERLLIIPPLPL